MDTTKVKKILSIVIISLILAVTILTIVLALVPKKLYNPISEGYSAVTVYKDKNSNTYTFTGEISEEQRSFRDNLDKYVKNSVKDNMLSSIFQGTGRYEAKVISREEGNVMNNVANVSGSTCLIFQYLEEQKLIFNGKEYKNPQALDPDKTITYTKLYMPISNTDDFQEAVVYLTDKTNKSSYQIKFLAHQSEIYSYLTGLTWDLEQSN